MSRLVLHDVVCLFVNGWFGLPSHEEGKTQWEHPGVMALLEHISEFV